MPSRTRLSTLITASAFLATAAETVAGGDWEASAQATNDYVYRGLSQTQGEAALQLDVHYRADGGWFVGSFASTVQLDDDIGPRFEINPYLGYTWALAPDFTATFMATRYIYRDGTQYIDYDYDELSVSLEFDGRLALSAAWSPDVTRYTWEGVAEDRTVFTFELTGYQPVTARLALSAGLGYQDLSELFGRGYWFYGAGWTWTAGAFSWDMFRYGVDHNGHELFEPEVARDGWSTAVRWRF